MTTAGGLVGHLGRRPVHLRLHPDRHRHRPDLGPAHRGHRGHHLRGRLHPDPTVPSAPPPPPRWVTSSTSLTATSPAEARRSRERHRLHRRGHHATTAADLFTYAAGPAVTAITPTPGPLTGGTAVTVTGANFTAGSTVAFGTTPATSVSFTNATTLTATAPAGFRRSVDVTVTTAGGTCATSAADLFTYDAVPTVTAIAPTSGPVAGGTVVTVTGSGFTAASTVAFGTTPATTVTVTSATTLTATSPGVPPGPWTSP